FGMERGAVPVLTGMAAGVVPGAGRARPGLTAVGSHLVPARLIAELMERALRALKEFHRREPAERGMPLETLRRSACCPEWLAEAAIAAGLAARRLTVDGGIARLAGFEPTVAGGAAGIDRGGGGGAGDGPAGATLARRRPCPAQRGRAGARDRTAGRGRDAAARGRTRA